MFRLLLTFVAISGFLGVAIANVRAVSGSGGTFARATAGGASAGRRNDRANPAGSSASASSGSVVARAVAGSSTKPSCTTLYKRYSNQHTGCTNPNPTCRILPSSIEQSHIDVILSEHNKYRSKIATGSEAGLPKASNMLRIVWDDELAMIAQRHAENCDFNHDCNDCRRVQNFGVGQNLYKESMSNRQNSITQNWSPAVKAWYDEVKYFKSDYIDPFVGSSGEPTYGHFSQVVWADSWKIGCGFTSYEDGKGQSNLYVCNYGPGGNIKAGSMYKSGEACTQCPSNSCCDGGCKTDGYPGLCAMKDENQAPKYEVNGNYTVYCDFQDQPYCVRKVTSGVDKWKISKTLSGNYFGIVLNGGEESTLSFPTPFQGKDSVCFVTYYRSGPQVAGQETAHTATEIFTITEDGSDTNVPLPRFGQAQFSKFKMGLGWNMETKFAIKFAVPKGKPSQYLEIKSIAAKEGSC